MGTKCIVFYKKFFSLFSIPGILILVMTCARGCLDSIFYVLIILSLPVAIAYVWNQSLYSHVNFNKTILTYKRFELIGLMLAIYMSITVWWIVIDYFVNTLQK